MPSPFHHQIVVYAADPHRLARFWAEAMGYVLEDNSRLIEGVLAAGAATEADTTVIDGRRFWSEAVAIGHPDDPVDDATGIVLGRRILFELQVTEKSGENRLHIDINVGRERLAEETERLVALGATLLYERRDPPRGYFNRLADPEGNEFCLQ
ncbi:MAG TPA: VOC family protein [Candidatus Limnocylindrales bacterium]|nr:VOC family protein [Candidatus Limnocylindrales bacterium]